MNTFEESDLLFTFPPDWIVRKFDGTVAYQSLSGHGLKGVDFLCLVPPDSLYLLEVKNYRSRDERYRIARRDPKELAAHVGKKFSDTKRLIRIVNKALRRKWWMGLLLRWYSWHPPRLPAPYWFWLEAQRRMEEVRLTCILWLEIPERTEYYKGAVREALNDHLAPDDTLILTEMEGPTALPITARPL